MTRPAAEQYLAQLPPQVDAQRLREQLAAVAPPFEIDHWLIPLPVWAVRAFDHGPDTAWQNLRDDLVGRRSTTPMCIYVHVPFCSSKCDFCDCYSFAVRSNIDTTMEHYVDSVCGELAAWSSLGELARRPVSTVHLGGGTPTFLGPDQLRRLVERIRSSFAVGPDTELALETTVESLTPAMIDTMEHLGIRRVHIGVQSLDDRVRRVIGRRSPAAAVRREIDAARARGWITSVDLVCGLPQQEIPSFIDDIQSLIAAGVDGFSLYEFLVYPQNHDWAERQGISVGTRNHLPNYVMFLAGSQVLVDAGFGTNTFNHWANDRDQNVYFTFPTRGEDCLAVGSIADGVFGDYHYRHPRHTQYLRGTRRNRVGLHGGLRRTAYENHLHPLVSAVLSGRIPPQVAREIDRLVPAAAPLTDTWRDRRLVEDGPAGGLVLTASGSWFAGNMVKGLTNMYPERTLQG